MFADNWCIKSSERIYGPYTSAELRKFAHEGRFAARTLVAPAGSRDWREARAEPSFAQFFGLAASAEAPNGFGRRDDAAREPRRARPIGQQRHAPSTEQQGSATANFVVIFDVVNAAASRVENALTSLGTAIRLARTR